MRRWCRTSSTRKACDRRLLLYDSICRQRLVKALEVYPKMKIDGFGMRDLGTLSSDIQSIAQKVNKKGQVVGDSWLSGPFPHAFIWEAGIMSGLGTLGGEWS